jgi:Cof subfamily protein (haloacid dehalogenase superfamily)
LVALDLDNTLLSADRSVSARNIAALRAAAAQGIEIVLASGRMLPAMEPAAAALGLDVVLVSYNGAAINGRASEGRPRILHRPLHTEIARELYAFARRERLQVNYYLDDVIVSEDQPHLRPWIDIYIERTGSPYRFVPSLGDYLDRAPTKLLLVMEPHRREAIADHFSARLKDRADVVKTDPEYLEFLDPAANKGLAVQHIATQLGLDMSEVMAMGDGENDVPLLQRAGWPVAVANAGAACKAVAAASTIHDHDHDAVAEALEKWVL